MKSGHTSFSLKTIRRGSGVSTEPTLSCSNLALAPRYRSKENFASSAVTGSPLWKAIPSRMVNSWVSPSGDMP